MEQKLCKYCYKPIRKWKVYCNLECRNKGYIGRKLTAEHSKNISEALKKAKYQRKNVFQTGEKHLFWNPNRTDQRERLTGHYRDWRYAVIKRDKWTCQICGDKRSSGKKSCVDHIKSFALFPELRFDITNGRVLCTDCHRLTETYCRKRYAKFVGKENEWQTLTPKI